MPLVDHLSSDEQAIADLLMQGVLDGDLDVAGWHEDYWPGHDASIRIDTLEDVEVSLVTAVMRKTGLPLVQDWRWAAWDPEDGLVRTSQCSGQWDWLSMKRAARHWRVTEEPVDVAASLLHRSRISTDHGYKPMLVRSEALHSVLRGEVFRFDLPRNVSAAELSTMALVYFTREGKTKSVPASDAAKLTKSCAPLCTRNALYVPEGGGLRPLPNNARFIADSFTIALHHNPNSFCFYRLRREGTIFQPGIERLAGPANAFVACPALGPGAQQVARLLTEWCISQGDVWLTVHSSHPLEADLVTTPQHYELAVKQIEQRTGKRLSYSIPGAVTLGDPIEETPLN